MKKTTIKLQTLLLLCALISFIACSDEENSYEEFKEELTVKPDADGSDTVKASCDTCSGTVYPGSHNNFKAALQKMDLEHRWNGGANENNISAAHGAGACNVDYFTRCSNWMVLSSGGQKNDRVELKLPSAYNQSLNNFSQMYFLALVEYIPSSASSKNKGVTIAQIHNRGSNVERPLARVDIAGYNKKVRVTFAHGYLKSDGQVAYDLVDYDQGDLLRVITRINSSGNKVFIYVKNETKNTFASKTYTAGRNWIVNNGSITSVGGDWSTKDGTYYYKAGVYQQLGTTAPRISFKQLVVNSL